MSGGEAAEGEVDGRTLFLYDGETADLEFDIGVLKVRWTPLQRATLRATWR